MRILVTRPREDAVALAAALASRGHQAVISPALEVEHLVGPPLETGRYVAGLITSANAVRALAARTRQRGLRLVCVGVATAAAARAEGFDNLLISDGEGVAGMLDVIQREMPPETGLLLYPSAEIVAGDLEKSLSALGYRLDREILYRARLAMQLSDEAEKALENNALAAVTYFSARSVRGLAMAAQNTPYAAILRDLPAICLSQAVAQAAQAHAARTLVAAEATQDAVLNVIDRLSVGPL